MRALLCVIFLGGPVAFGLGHILPLPTASSASFEPTFEARASLESLANNPHTLWPVEHDFGHGDSLDRPQWGCPIAFHYGAPPHGFCGMATVSGFVEVNVSEGQWRLSLRWREGGAGTARLLDANGRTLTELQGADGALEAGWPLDGMTKIGAATHIELLLDAQPEHVYLGALMCLDETLEGPCETWLDASDGEGAARIRLATEPATKQLGLEWVHSFGPESRLLLLDDTGGVLQALDCLPASGFVSLQPGVVNGLSAFRLERSTARFVDAVVSNDCHALEVARSGEGVAGAPVASSRGGAGKASRARKGETLECPPHSADQDGNFSISLSELLRVIQFFNTGGYRCAPGTEDGYAPGAGAQDCAPHDSDYNPQDWEIRLTELLRLVQLFNVGTAEPCPEAGTEDGFCVDIGNLVLNGPAAVNVECGDIYEDPGASIEAHCGGSFEAVVSITPEVNLDAPLDTGQYLITYALPDNSGKQVTRSLSVADTIAPEVSFPANPMYFENTIFQDFEVTDEGCGGEVERAFEFQNLDSQNSGDPPQVRVTATDAAGNSVTTEWQDIEVRKPNILLINLDDLNDWVTHMQVFSREGATDYESLTPNLQRLAQRSRVFKYTYSAAPISNPSRVSVVTGRHPVNSGVYFSGRWFRLRSAVESASNKESLAKYLATYGYQTYGIGRFAFDGGHSNLRWQEWMFGSNMNDPLPDADDRYWRRPREPIMMDAVHVPAIDNAGILVQWGVNHLAVTARESGELVNPDEQNVVRLTAGASVATPRTYEIDLRNQSGVYTYDWSLCMVSNEFPPRYCEITPQSTGGDFSVSRAHGTIAPDNDPLDPHPQETVTVEVRRNRNFQLVVVPGNDGDGPRCPCIDNEVPHEPFNPVPVSFNGIKAYWDEALTYGANSRSLRIENNTDVLLIGMQLSVRAFDDDVRFDNQPPPFNVPLLLPGGATSVNVTWGPGLGTLPDRWVDFDDDNTLFPVDAGNFFPDFRIDVQSSSGLVATVWNEFKAETPVPGQGLQISDALVANQVIRWLSPEELGNPESNEPFFLSAGIYRPHIPHYAPQEYYDRAQKSGPPAYWADRPLGRDAAPGIAPEPSVWGRSLVMNNLFVRPYTELAQLEELRDAYLASIAYGDAQLGRILDAVYENDYLKKSTIIAVWSDHGYHLGEQSHLMKSTLWERSNLVPMMFSIPGMYTEADAGADAPVTPSGNVPIGISESAVISAPVSLVDLYPTLLDLGGAPEPEFLRNQREREPEAEVGRAISLVPLIFGTSDVRSDLDSDSSVPVLSSFTRIPCGFTGDSIVNCNGANEGDSDIVTHAIRVGPYRYIRYNFDPLSTDHSGNELYNLSIDPFEKNNIIAQASAELLDEFHTIINQNYFQAVWEEHAREYTQSIGNLTSNKPVIERLNWDAAWGSNVTIALDLANPESRTLYNLMGSVYVDADRFTVSQFRLPQAQAQAGWRLTVGQQDGGATVTAHNFRMDGGVFNQPTHQNIILVDVECIDPIGCGGSTVNFMSNERTRITGRKVDKAAVQKGDALPGATIPLEPFVYIAPPND